VVTMKDTLFWVLYRLLLQVSYLTYSSTLKMETLCSSKILDFLRTTQHYKPEEQSLHFMLASQNETYIRK
jgi:hypothetical protein